VDIDAAIARMRHMPFEDLGFAQVDHHRALRHGIPEVIFAKGKTPGQVVAIAASCCKTRQRLINEGRSRFAPRRSRRSCRRRIRGSLPALSDSGATARFTAKPHQRGLRRHQRYAGARGSSDHRRIDGQ